MNDPSRDHPLRRLLNDEVHARPSLQAPPRARVTHFALMTGEEPRRDRDPLAELCQLANVAPPYEDARHALVEWDRTVVKWERHTEFVSVTIITPDDGGTSGTGDPWSALTPELARWAYGLPGLRLVAVHLRLEPDGLPHHDATSLAGIFGGETVGSVVLGGDALVWTDFRIGRDGYTHWLVRNINLTGQQAGRLIQRLLEVETYRLTALLALPMARDVAGQLAVLERRLETIVEATANEANPEQDHKLLDDLTRLAAEAERLLTNNRFRFNASAAYADLVWRRLTDLQEARITGLQRIGLFLDRRFRPAMRTCETVTRRQLELVDGIARASAMLRTRVDVQLAEQNAALLRAMDSRTRTQLRIQEAVEGLSIFAITYYVIGLLKYVMDGLPALGLHPDKAAIAALALPLVGISIWLGVRRVRRAIHSSD
jgi:uncharacterized membrane-anchored protein